MMQETVPMQSILEKNLKEDRKQPMLIVLGTRGRTGQVFVVIEGQGIEIKKCNIVSGIDKLMKLYFVMNMSYPIASAHVFSFIQKYVMNIKDDLNVPRCVVDLISAIRARSDFILSFRFVRNCLLSRCYCLV